VVREGKGEGWMKGMLGRNPKLETAAFRGGYTRRKIPVGEVGKRRGEGSL
jgi:hypothetical protein